MPGNQIQAVRLNRGISRLAFARKVGASAKHIFVIEQGKVNPSLDLLMRILDALDCDFRDLYPKAERQVPAA